MNVVIVSIVAIWLSVLIALAFIAMIFRTPLPPPECDCGSEDLSLLNEPEVKFDLRNYNADRVLDALYPVHADRDTQSN